ncbi:hypothetical protein O1611_g5175 [Lasiodiplodia mahajangana]|uniref:Uncharacterized protein n=1 Tax=Lasiodiplodia mahajangana TaxID=1108764 RepID=A0ACC2JM27_9PEZI|nr:hypothetical protein O1611_g5175 [Lasiodiplodia mahajangana]
MSGTGYQRDQHVLPGSYHPGLMMTRFNVQSRIARLLDRWPRSNIDMSVGGQQSMLHWWAAGQLDTLLPIEREDR